MFIHPVNKMNRQQDIHRFINDYSFGILVSKAKHKNDTTTESLIDLPELIASHIPFILKPDEGKKGTLYCHVAKANFQANSEAVYNEALVIFNGPHAYISPSLYNKTPNVPTWNYAAVHANGIASLVSDQVLLASINELVNKFEPQLNKDANSEMATMPASYVKKLLNSIVGIKIEIKHLTGQIKLGQNRSNADQLRIYEALKRSSRSTDNDLADFMHRNIIGI